jgi:hypothetical protein
MKTNDLGDIRRHIHRHVHADTGYQISAPRLDTRSAGSKSIETDWREEM